MNPLHSIRTEFDHRCEKFNSLIFIQGVIDKCRLDNTFLAIGGSHKRIGKPCTSKSHGKSGRACAILSLNDFIASELDMLNEFIKSRAADIRVPRVGNQRNDGNTRMAANDRNIFVGWIRSLDLRDKS